jgi:hypothetical protein
MDMAIPQELQDKWGLPLVEHCVGTPVLLTGIDVFIDFPWDRCSNSFKNGQNISLEVTRAAKNLKKKPALLLSKTSELQHFETEEWFVSVIPFNQCINRHLSRDGAFGYLWAPSIKGSAAFLAVHAPDQVRLLVGSFISTDEVTKYVKADGKRLEAVLELLRDDAGFVVSAELALLLRGLSRKPASSVAGADGHEAADAPTAEVVEALTDLANIDSEVALALVDALQKITDREDRLKALRALTETSDGISDAGSVFGERLPERIKRARDIADRYDELVRTEGETALQEFIQEHPWLIGLEYEKVRPKQPLVRGAADFVLQRYDGRHDILELKSPQDPIIKAAERQDGKPASPHEVTLSPALAQAIAQSHEYRHQLTDSAPSMESEYGLKGTRYPRIIIVIGRSSVLNEKAKLILEQLGLTLHRVEIIPFDHLGNRAKVLLRNIEQNVEAAPEPAPSEAFSAVEPAATSDYQTEVS